MGKTIGLQQLALKKYVLVPGMPEDLTASIGEIEDSFDAIIYGSSNHGKSSFIAIFLIALIKALDCRCEYVAYEEGHGKTVQDTMIKRYDMFNQLGHCMQITDHLTYDELYAKMGRKKSAKIWVIDSIQASRFTATQMDDLKRKYVGKKHKIIITVSWAKGKKPHGAVAEAVEYYANIKMFIEDLIMYPKSRYGGGKRFIVHRKTCIDRIGEKEFYKRTGEKPPPKPKKEKLLKSNPNEAETTIAESKTETNEGIN